MAAPQYQPKFEQDDYPSRTFSEPMLIRRHDPVIYSNEIDNAPLSEAQIAEYEKNGFLFLDDIFSESELSSMVAEMQSMRDDQDIKSRGETVTERSSKEVRSVFAVHQLNELFGRIAEDPRLVAVAEYILGDRVYVHQSRLNYKPGFWGREFYWHSDFETWHTEDGMPRMRALSMSITLTDNDDTNGPLMLVPSSHKTYVSCVGETPKNHHVLSLKKQEFGVPDKASMSELIEQGGIVTATGPIGRIVLFDCNTMHGSNSNITPIPRSNLFFVYNALSNKVTQPFGHQPPRPEYIGARQSIRPLKSALFK